MASNKNGYVPIEIPTKRYILAFMKSRLGDKLVMDKPHPICSKLYDVLQSKKNDYAYLIKFGNQRYPVTAKIYIPRYIFIRKGVNLNKANIKAFNNFIEWLIKEEFHSMMDLCYSILPNYEQNLNFVRPHIGIYEADWASDSMLKDYYRYRLENGKVDKNKFLQKLSYGDEYKQNRF